MAVNEYVLAFHEIDRTRVADVGGKGAHLGELARIEGARVPDGFCVTTEAFRRVLADAPGVGDLVGRLSRLDPDDREAVRAHSAEVRRAIEETAVPDDVAAAIIDALAGFEPGTAVAVRSSATAEDSPAASFAGLHDTSLYVVGAEAVLRHVRRCWASLFTERAVAYRLQNGTDHGDARMGVVVQRMVAPEASGVLFTADPVTGHRRVTVIEVVFGLGEALVSGAVNADRYSVRDGEVVETAVAAKRVAVHAAPGGGTEERAVEPERQAQPALTDGQAVELAGLGRHIEAHFGRPQDVEWCLAGGAFHVVQSRPITTLFPVPEAGDGAPHVYVSVGHQQMMTDALRPLGLSFWQLTAGRPMAEAGGRLFVDVAPALASPAGRAGLLGVLGKSDPLIGDALRTLLDRDDAAPSLPGEGPGEGPASTPPAGEAPASIETDPALVAGLVARHQASVAALRREIRGRTGPDLLDFIRTDLQELKRFLFDPQSLQAIMAGMEAAWWLGDHLHEWLGETHAADVLTRSVPHNVTSEMGLALLDVADAIRPHPGVVAFLERVEDDGFLDGLPALAGGRGAREAIEAWLDVYGMRGAGEIDITRPRWSERPAMLVPVLLGHVRNAEPGDGPRRFEQGRREAAEKEREVLERLRALPDGERKATEAKRRIDRVRTFAGYREYPKYGWVSCYLVYKRALMEEAERLVRAGVLQEAEDIFYLRFEELHDVVRTHRVDEALVRERKEAFRWHQTLTPPRVMTSEGEVVTGSYRRGDVPAGALVGLAVSAGTVEGRARVLHDMAEADLEPGDILVTPFTDPSWTPLFVAVAGLVTEVGGLMTHGAVIAREYGLPAVVGVEGATRRIRDGDRVRVHGTDGYVEVLP